MSTSDKIAFFVVGPIGVLGVWIQVWRIWVRGADTSKATAWMHGEAGKVGYHAFLFPAAIAMTSLLAGVILVFAGGYHSGSVETHIGEASMVAGILFMPVAFWMWAFAWPRFLVPPQFRGQRGLIPESIYQWRQRHTTPDDESTGEQTDQ